MVKQQFLMKMPDSNVDKQKVDLGLLEEDDEFEEFPTENWFTDTDPVDDEVSVWEDNWEDDIVQDDFNQQLKLYVQAMQEANPDLPKVVFKSIVNQQAKAQQLEKLKDQNMD